ncbi:helix-turn-helix transcriptional regulator [Nonomuraea sp. B12E4]|uniref:helix-turn-helix domain-containing protein n=1 Tax=Nonomuraea sp. B12E4 TaxID=3153564 RepID=UPI00325F4DE8
MSTAHGRDNMADVPGGDARQAGPTALRMLVGAELRRLREAREISRDQAGYLIRGSQSKISRLETGRTSFKPRDVDDLLTLYGVTDTAERAALLALVKQANLPGWWQDYRDVIPEWFEDYLGLEQDASLIRTYEVQFVPGLLQTEDYARAVISRGCGNEPEARIERRVAVRTHRRQVLTGPSPCRVWAMVDEAALRRPVGGAAVMRAQLEHLTRMAGLPHITLQVIPFSTDAVVAGAGPVTLLRFPQAGLADVIYLEQLTSAQYLSKADDVGPYLHFLNSLGIHASSPPATTEMLRRLIAEL